MRARERVEWRIRARDSSEMESVTGKQKSRTSIMLVSPRTSRTKMS